MAVVQYLRVLLVLLARPIVTVVAAALLAGTGVLGPVSVPLRAQWLGFLIIGVQVGLRFTRDSVR